MKGQYRIVMEVLLFGIGVAITSFVIVNFQGLQENAAKISLDDQLAAEANKVLNGIVKASLAKNSLVRVSVPAKLSGNVYKFEAGSGKLTVSNLAGTGAVSREIFNIHKSYDIEGEVVSSAGAVEIFFDGTGITLQRG